MSSLLTINMILTELAINLVLVLAFVLCVVALTVLILKQFTFRDIEE